MSTARERRFPLRTFDSIGEYAEDASSALDGERLAAMHHIRRRALVVTVLVSDVNRLTNTSCPLVSFSLGEDTALNNKRRECTGNRLLVTEIVE